MSTETYIVIAVIALAFFTLLGAYLWHYGRKFGLIIAALRAIWIIPIVLALFPRVQSTELPATTFLQPIKVLLDDSLSISRDADTQQKAQEAISLLREQCLRLGCSVEVAKLSDLTPDAEKSETPLVNGLLTFLERNKNNPWVLLSDGGDHKPTQPLPINSLKDAVVRESQGAILALGPEVPNNYWLSDIVPPPLSFEEQPTSVTASVRRSKTSTKKAEQLQLQLLSAGKILHSQNIVYAENDDVISVDMVIPGLRRGQHLLSLRLLPVPGETVTWDNEANFNVEVMANTIGVLHLLGSPSWDGRFLRRYLKSEPKYDLISFFILRDRWDSQAVSERELSLIPFPVDRLFNEELQNFKVVVIQNFALFEFLQPEYQENLVKFVKDGGGLLFAGGPRALGRGDVVGSRLAEILPFKYRMEKNTPQGLDSIISGMTSGRQGRSGLVFNTTQKFKIEFTDLGREKREFASLLDHWEGIKDGLEEAKNLRGLHDMTKADFSDRDHTTLLHAKLADGKKWPLAVASYPGKGRAVWLFTDSFWRFSTAQNAVRSRNVHQLFFNSTMNWLLRQEVRQPLYVTDFHVEESVESQSQWQAYLKGPAAKYFRSLGSWKVSVCGVGVDLANVYAQPTGHEEFRIKGSVPVGASPGTLCRIQVKAHNDVFGAVLASASNSVPRRFLDDELGRVDKILEGLAKATSAQLFDTNSDMRVGLRTWLVGNLGEKQLVVPTRTETRADHFWFLSLWIFALIPIAMLAEVILRRWIISPVKENAAAKVLNS